MPDLGTAGTYAVCQGWLVVQEDMLTLTTAGRATPRSKGAVLMDRGAGAGSTPSSRLTAAGGRWHAGVGEPAVLRQPFRRFGSP